MSEFFSGFVQSGTVPLWTYIAYNVMMIVAVFVPILGVAFGIRKFRR